jgi:hypothetical protein
VQEISINRTTNCMRKVLSQENGNRKKYRAVFSRFGKKTNYNGYSEDTILLTKITDVEKNETVADHLWFSFTKGFESIQLTEGTVIEFEARVKEYSKGYVNSRYKINNRASDFKLSNPTKIKVIS